MIILNQKIKSATLVETVVATTLILMVFGLAMFIMTNVIGSAIKKEHHQVEYTENKLNYLKLNNQNK